MRRPGSMVRRTLFSDRARAFFGPIESERKLWLRILKRFLYANLSSLREANGSRERAEPVIRRRYAPTGRLAMTELVISI
jgi:hypothetical protein